MKKIIILTILCVMLMPTVVFAKTSNQEKVVKVGYFNGYYDAGNGWIRGNESNSTDG